MSIQVRHKEIKIVNIKTIIKNKNENLRKLLVKESSPKNKFKQIEGKENNKKWANYLAQKLAGVSRFELEPAVLETVMLPLTPYP